MAYTPPWGRRGSDASRIYNAKRILGQNPCSLEIKVLEGKPNVEKPKSQTWAQGRTASISSSVRRSLEASVGSGYGTASLLGAGALNSLSRDVGTTACRGISSYLPVDRRADDVHLWQDWKIKGRSVSVWKEAESKTHWSSHFSRNQLS